MTATRVRGGDQLSAGGARDPLAVRVRLLIGPSIRSANAATASVYMGAGGGHGST